LVVKERETCPSNSSLGTQPFDILTPEAAHPQQNMNILTGRHDVEEVAIAFIDVLV
jgi:hypothetical protein